MKVPAGVAARIAFFALLAGLMGGLSGDADVAFFVFAIGVPVAYLDFRRDQDMRRDYSLLREQWGNRRKKNKGLTGDE